MDAKWTFRSRTTADVSVLPLLHVRLHPQDLDELNRAKRGTSTSIPICVERPGGPADDLRPKVEVSFDDGAAWRTTRLVYIDGQWSAWVNNPAAGDFASLRVSAGSGDDSVVQTIIRAYGLTS